MDQASAETGTAINAVRDALRQRQTGCVHVHVAGRGDCDIFVMDGEILAAQSPKDGEAIVGRLIARGGMTESQGDRIREHLERGTDPLQVLASRLSEADLERLLLGRFRQNLLDFLFDAGRHEFELMQTVRVPHMQLGHDTVRMLDQMERIHARVSPWAGARLERRVIATRVSPQKDADQRVQAICREALVLNELIERSPFFEAETVHRVIRMLESGAVEVEEIEAPPVGPRAESVAHAVRTAEAEQARRAQAAGHSDHHPDDAEVRADQARVTSPADLVAFQDHEGEERGLGKGRFSDAEPQRDRVDLDIPPRRLGPQTRVPELRFQGPLLATEEIVRKTGVCNEVLSSMVRVWDAHHGSGEGRTVVQLAVAGAPLDYAPLFRGVQVDRTGRMGAEMIVQNVERRPDGERRRLVNDGLRNLVDRVLSRCAEGLDDEELESLLGHIAGFRQRLGL